MQLSKLTLRVPAAQAPAKALSAEAQAILIVGALFKGRPDDPQIYKECVMHTGRGSSTINYTQVERRTR